MYGTAGTWRLVRLALRRDRIKLVVWLLVIIGFTAIMPPALEETYGKPAAREAYYATLSTNAVGRMFGGIVDDATMGSIIMVESFVFLAVLVAVMNVLFVVRHTRQNEEMGSTELLLSGRVDRYAPLTATLLIAVALNVLIGVGMAAVLMTSDVLSVDGNILFGIAQGSVGMTTAAFAALGVQLFTNTRVTTVFLSLGIAVMFFVRAFGDGLAKTVDGRVESTWLSWLSPMGWGQQLYPYTRQETWVLWLFVGAITASLTVAYILVRYRDVGQGLLADRLGRARASALLRTTEGLTWRLQYMALFGWVVVIAILGSVYGAMAPAIEDLAKDNPVLQEYVAAIGGGDKLVEGFMASMIALMAMTALAYIAQSLGRLQAEEMSGRLENILATATGRLRWASGHALFVLGGSIILLLISSVAMALVVRAVTDGGSWSLGEYVLASLNYAPALAVCWAVVVMVFAFMPRLTSAAGWLIFALAFSWYQFGALLKFPDWLKDISPFSHIPLIPLEDAEMTPLIILSAIALGCVVISVIRFKFRDIKLT